MAKLKITMIRSTAGSRKDQIATMKALGLKKIGCTVEQEDTPSIRGMIKKVEHLINVEEI